MSEEEQKSTTWEAKDYRIFISIISAVWILIASIAFATCGTKERICISQAFHVEECLRAIGE
jgi:hypothetical protein